MIDRIDKTQVYLHSINLINKIVAITFFKTDKYAQADFSNQNILEKVQHRNKSCSFSKCRLMIP